MYFNGEQKMRYKSAVADPALAQLLADRKAAVMSNQRVEPEKAFVLRFFPGARCEREPKYRQWQVVDAAGPLADCARASRDAWGGVVSGLFLAFGGKL